jgi:hypothetical protein
MQSRVKATTEEKKLGKQISRVLQDPYGQNWPDSLLFFLNASFKDYPAELIERARLVDGEKAEELVSLNQKHPAYRKQQQELRGLADFYLETGNIAETVNRLQEILNRQPYRVSVWVSERQGKGAKKNGPVVQVKTVPINQPGQEVRADFLGFARLLESEKRKQLRKCPECGTYFLARRGKKQKCCSARCRKRVQKREFKMRHPEAYRAKKAAEMRRYRQRKKEQNT